MTITKMRVVGFVMRVFVVQLRNKSVEIKGNIFLLKQVSLQSLYNVTIHSPSGQHGASRETNDLHVFSQLCSELELIDCSDLQPDSSWSSWCW